MHHNDEKHFENALRSLRKPQTEKRLQQILLVVRAGISSSRDSAKLSQLHRSGCVKIIADLLKHDAPFASNLHIINVALSIIGNACQDHAVAKELIRKIDVVPRLCRICRDHDVDSIRGRYFRILGNLCDGWNARAVIESSPEICDLFNVFFRKAYCDNNAEDTTDSRVTETTIIMSLRAARKILKRNTARIVISEGRILVGVGLLFVKYVKAWMANKSGEIIVEDLLKVMHCYSSHSNNDVVLQLRNSTAGDAIALLPHLLVLNPFRVVRIVMNLTMFCSNKSDLPILNMMTTLNDLALATSDTNPIQHRNYLLFVTRMLDHPGHREYVLESGTIDTLLELFDNQKSPSSRSLPALTVIMMYFHKLAVDLSSIKKHLFPGPSDGRLFRAIMAKLTWLGDSGNMVQIYSHDKSQQNDVEGDVDTDQAPKSPRINVTKNGSSKALNSQSPEIPERSLSPSTSSEISSNGPYSPMCNNIEDDLSDSNDYSPVCSDNEEIDFTADVDMKLDSKKCSPILKHSPELQNSIVELTSSISTFLYTCASINPSICDLAQVDLCTVLVNISFRRNDAAVKTVKKIVKNKETLISFMFTDFISQLYEAAQIEHKQCRVCARAENNCLDIIDVMCKVAENTSFRGELFHHLTKANDDQRFHLIYSSIFLIKSNQVMRKILVQYKGADILFGRLRCAKSYLDRRKVIVGLTELCSQVLNISDPREYTRTETKCADLKFPQTVVLSAITFRLDDGRTIAADRNQLSKRSDYFNSMLNGTFREATETVIALRNVSYDTLRILFSLLDVNYPTVDLDVLSLELDTVLDVILVADRYLIPDLSIALALSVELHRITATNLCSIYRWSLLSHTNLLRVECVAYLLVGKDLNVREKVRLFQEIVESADDAGDIADDGDLQSMLYDDVENLVMRYIAGM